MGRAGLSPRPPPPHWPQAEWGGGGRWLTGVHVPTGDITVEGLDKERQLQTGEIIIIVAVLLMWAGVCGGSGRAAGLRVLSGALQPGEGAWGRAVLPLHCIARCFCTGSGRGHGADYRCPHRWLQHAGPLDSRGALAPWSRPSLGFADGGRGVPRAPLAAQPAVEGRAGPGGAMSPLTPPCRGSGDCAVLPAVRHHQGQRLQQRQGEGEAVVRAQHARAARGGAPAQQGGCTCTAAGASRMEGPDAERPAPGRAHHDTCWGPRFAVPAVGPCMLLGAGPSPVCAGSRIRPFATSAPGEWRGGQSPPACVATDKVPLADTMNIHVSWSRTPATPPGAGWRADCPGLAGCASPFAQGPCRGVSKPWLHPGSRVGWGLSCQALSPAWGRWVSQVGCCSCRGARCSVRARLWEPPPLHQGECQLQCPLLSGRKSPRRSTSSKCERGASAGPVQPEQRKLAGSGHYSVRGDRMERCLQHAGGTSSTGLHCLRSPLPRPHRGRDQGSWPLVERPPVPPSTVSSPGSRQQAALALVLPMGVSLSLGSQPRWRMQAGCGGPGQDWLQ